MKTHFADDETWAYIALGEGRERGILREASLSTDVLGDDDAK